MFIILIQPLQKIWVLIEFELNRETIAQKLCEKRNELPQIASHCAGSCMLRKNLQQIDDQSDASTLENTTYNFEKLFFQDFFELSLSPITFIPYKKRSYKAYQPISSTTFPQDILRPPITLAVV